MSKNKQRLWLLSMLLIYAAIAVAGFTIAYVIKNDFLSSSNNQQTQIANKVTSAPLPAGWKIYENNDCQIKFSYPSADTLQTKSYGFGVSSVTVEDSKGNTDFQILLLPESLGQAVGQNFDSYYAMPANTTKTIKNPLSQGNATEKFTKISNRNVNGNQALDYQSIASNAKPGTIPEIGTFIKVGSNLVLISTGQENKQNLGKILNSFRYPL